MKNTKRFLATLVALVATTAFAQAPEKAAEAKPAETKAVEAKTVDAKPAKTGLARNCDELKASVAEKIEAKGVKNYTLDIVATEDVKDGKVVGSCGGGTKKIVYTRG